MRCSYKDLTITLLEKKLAIGTKIERIDVVFNDYRQRSIKSIERKRLYKGWQLQFKQIVASSKV